MAEQLVRVARKKLCPDQSSLASEVPIDCFSVLDALPDQAAVVDHAGVIIRTNKAWRDFSAANGGTPDQTGQGINYLSVCCSEEEQVVHTSAQLRELLAGEREVLSLEYPCHSPQQQRWFLMRAQRLRGGALITHTDITQRKLAELQAERLASHDPLTLTLNRRGFSHRLAAEMSRVRRRGGTVSAILIDIDDFKSINSHFGHAVGDIVLVEVARRFCDLLRAEDLLARIGGDEFLVVLPSTDEPRAVQVVERLRLAVSSSSIVSREDGSLPVTCSAAVAGLGEECEQIDQILRACRGGLARSKSRGKNRTTGAGGLLGGANREAMDTPFIVRQPIVRMTDGALAGYELLARGPGEPTEPLAFFRQASEDGDLLRVDLACLRAGLRRVPEFSSELSVHLNLYPSTLLATEVSYILDQIAVADRGRICLELSDQEVISDPMFLRGKLRALRATGISIAFDDVGFGRTSLESLVALEPSTVKIDRRLTYGVSRDSEKAKLLERVLRLSLSLGATVVAEGIEDEADARLCRDCGVPLGQGFFWGEPKRF